VVDGEDISARLIVQAARQSGLSAVYHDLLDFGGDELYVISEPALAGRTFGAALLGVQECCPIGLVRVTDDDGQPADGHGHRRFDKLVILAATIPRQPGGRTPARCTSLRGLRPRRPPRAHPHPRLERPGVRIIDQLDKYVTRARPSRIVTDARTPGTRSTRCPAACGASSRT